MKTARAYTDYDPIRIIWPVKGDEVTDEMASQVGLTGTYELITKDDLPADRNDRNEWEYDKQEKKVKANAQKVQAKLDKEQAKLDKKNSIKNKLKDLGLTNDEVDTLLGVE